MIRTIYAIYSGDKFLTVGTAKECAKDLHLSENTIYLLAAPTYQKRKSSFKKKNKDYIIIKWKEGD